MSATPRLAGGPTSPHAVITATSTRGPVIGESSGVLPSTQTQNPSLWSSLDQWEAFHQLPIRIMEI